MKISLITPADKQSRNGNRTTALRWARMLREAGHRVRIEIAYGGEAADLMIALHAWRSATAILRYRERFPGGPLVVGLGGTDVNTYLKSDPEPTLRSMEMADALICLHGLIGEALPAGLRKKLHVVHQSALPLAGPRRPAQRHFDICVIGHLREEKDPFRTAFAARRMAPTSKLRVIHLGRAHTPDFANQARAEMARNPRYRWLGEVPGWRVRRELAKTRAMVISSNQEGGANVVSEALAADVPVLSTRISGSIGILGEEYPGYFPVGGTKELADMLLAAEQDRTFYRSLQNCCRGLKGLVSPASERRSWRLLLEELQKSGLL